MTAKLSAANAALVAVSLNCSSQRPGRERGAGQEMVVTVDWMLPGPESVTTSPFPDRSAMVTGFP